MSIFVFMEGTISLKLEYVTFGNSNNCLFYGIRQGEKQNLILIVYRR